MATYIKRPFQRVTGRVSSVGSSTITTLSNVPTRGYIARVHAVLVSGTGSTISPVITTDSSATDLIKEIASTTAAAHVDEIPGAPISFVAETVDSTPTLYLKHAPNAGSDNVIDYAIDFWPGEL